MTARRSLARIWADGQDLLERSQDLPQSLHLIQVDSAEFRRIFDVALDDIHYAGACQRVGRCLRLAIVEEGRWVGGIVLGSTFPNLHDRDVYLGLTKYLHGYRERGLCSPWARENTAYWRRLQLVVNHARTFVFPQMQGRGIGVRSHRLLLSDGVKLWRKRYTHPVWALDTLCNTGESRLFAENGWSLVGSTKGYSAASKEKFSSRIAVIPVLRNNVALTKIRRGRRWAIWVRIIDESVGGDHAPSK
jgi:GNAT superfamily N-acetyltransferase